VASEYDHSDINDKIPQIRPEKCLEVSATIRVRVTTRPHVKMGGVLANGLMVLFNAIVFYIFIFYLGGGLTRGLTLLLFACLWPACEIRAILFQPPVN
jgi:hypothetical protein